MRRRQPTFRFKLEHFSGCAIKILKTSSMGIASYVIVVDTSKAPQVGLEQAAIECRMGSSHYNFAKRMWDQYRPVPRAADVQRDTFLHLDLSGRDQVVIWFSPQTYDRQGRHVRMWAEPNGLLLLPVLRPSTLRAASTPIRDSSAMETPPTVRPSQNDTPPDQATVDNAMTRLGPKGRRYI